MTIPSRVWVPAVITAVTAIITALLTLYCTSSTSERGVQAKFVELGVSILQAAPSKATENLRAWAVQVLNKYSGVPINEGAKNDLLRAVPLPPSSVALKDTPLQMYCACYADQTFCFPKESDCEEKRPDKRKICAIRYTDNGLFDIYNINKWSKYASGWVTKSCTL